MNKSNKNKVDVIVIGAGPAGLSFARCLAETGLNITIVEKQPESVLAAPPYDGREIALTHLSHDIMTNTGLWDLIPEENISLISSAKVLNGNSPYSLNFNHTETGKENLGFMISNHRIRKAAYDSLAGFSNISLLSKESVSDIHTDDRKGQVTLTGGEILEAPLVIAADSRFSSMRRMMGISTEMLDFGRVCIVCKMRLSEPHDGTAYECFHYDRTLAILPLKNNEVSIVITLGAEESDAVLGMSPEDFASDIGSRAKGQFGPMTLVTELFSYPLVATYAKQFYARRFALIGDAAVGMHPVTAHGFNLGLQSAYTLAKEITEALKAGGDIGSSTLLQRYSTSHRRASRPMYLGTNALVKLYTKNTPAARLARGTLLRLGNRIKPAKRMIMDRLTEIRAA